MNKLVICVFISAVVLNACKNKSSQKLPSFEKEEGEKSRQNTPVTLQDSIMGKWRLPEEDKFSLEIDGYNLTYYESVSIPYRLEKNTIVMSNPDGSKETAEVKFTKDTLLLRNSDQEGFTKHVRFR